MRWARRAASRAFSLRSRGAAWAVAACALAGGPALGCREEGPSTASRSSVIARFGILYGGQVQERVRIVRAPEPARESVGFKLESTPMTAEREVRWELVPPLGAAATKRASAVSPRTGSARWLGNGASFEQALAFEPRDPLGSWVISVRVAGELVLERQFELAPRGEARARPDAGF